MAEHKTMDETTKTTLSIKMKDIMSLNMQLKRVASVQQIIVENYDKLNGFIIDGNIASFINELPLFKQLESIIKDNMSKEKEEQVNEAYAVYKETKDGNEAAAKEILTKTLADIEKSFGNNDVILVNLFAVITDIIDLLSDKKFKNINNTASSVNKVHSVRKYL